jgi:protein TonB
LSFAPRPNILAALLVTALEVAMFAFGMRQARGPALPPVPIAVRLVTLPLPAPSVPAEAMPTIETAPPLPREPPPDAMPMIETEIPPPIPSEKPLPPRRHQARASRRTENPPAMAPASEMASAPAPAARAVSPPGGGTMGARAIYDPMPEIPEELRHHPMNLVAVARFRVAADGATAVELVQATADPRLNHALLAALATWRFFPAMANGRPVASTVDIRIPIAVR